MSNRFLHSFFLIIKIFGHTIILVNFLLCGIFKASTHGLKKLEFKNEKCKKRNEKMSNNFRLSAKKKNNTNN